MKSKFYYIINLSLIVMLLIASYLYGSHVQSRKTTEPDHQKDEWLAANEAKQEVVLTIWSPKPMMEYEIQSFQEAYPNITVQLTSFENEPRLSEHYLHALAEGNAPDLLVLPQAMLGSVNSVDLIADLTESNLNLELFRERMGEYLWNIHQSLDGKRTIALPYEAHPYVMYYRSDILEEKGYPNEPEQLAQFLSDPDQLLQLANDLKSDDQWLLQWDNDLITLVNNGQFIFDRDIEYQRESDFYRQIIDTTFKFKDLSANISIWSSLGQEMIRNNQLVTIMMPSYGDDLIAEWAPDQEGKWRVTRLPLGIEAIDVYTSTSLAVTEHSEHKAEAEKFLQHIMATSTVLNWLETADAHPYLGNQESGKLYMDIIKENLSTAIPTPLDARLFDVWNTSVEQSRRSNYTVEDAIHAAKMDVMDITSVAQKQLQLYIERSLQ